MVQFAAPTPFATSAPLGSWQLPEEVTAYTAKLRRGGRPTRLVLDFIVLAFSVLNHPGVPIGGLCRTLAADITAFAAHRLGVHPGESRALAAQLEQRIEHFTRKAYDELAPLAIPARLALIVVSETQRATADAFRAAAGLLTVIRRETTSPWPCDRCEQLAGDYHRPFPEELWETHPRCACVWARIAS